MHPSTLPLTLPVVPPMSGADRCDRCNAQAYARAVIGDNQLLFCGHHGRLHESALLDQGVVMIWAEVL